MSDFSPLSALLGGMLIGVAAVFLMATNGRVLGVAGIVGGLMGERGGKETAWRLAFVFGMVSPAMALGPAGKLPVHGSGLALPLLLLAGFLVGFGTRLGNGCTSGHGICGLARFSKRSLAAVSTFMAVAGATVLITRHGVGG